MPSDAPPLLEVRDLRVSFRTERGVVRAVDGVSFTVGQREILGLVGESGSGKTQTLLSVMGLIDDPNAAIEGSIRFQGQELVGLSRRALRAIRGRRIAMIFQDPMTSLTPVHTVGGQIVEQLRAHTDLSRAAARTRAVELLDAVGIRAAAAVAGRYPHELSGGMRQRVVIAMALSCHPALLIADEPTTALDVTVQAQILDLIGRLRDDFGSSVVLVTHDLGVVAEVADRVLVMYAGRIAEEGGKEAVFRRPLHPYTWGLFDSIPPLEGERPARLRSIPGAPPSLLALPRGCAFAPRCRHRFDACAERPPLAGAGGHRAACFHTAAAEARP
ncbi:ABC transporter ATP-binding protein [Azospirillum sp. ST 5-10]|uniref:ABC transporter ATP-binding protein n=1 Tax=unclassified Azospirillum TaxID=2630922 RepID=UPI003F49C317